MARASGDDSNASKAYQEAEKRIAAAKRLVSRTLDLSRLGLSSVPPEIGQLASLAVLHLSKNLLISVPPEIGQLGNLTELNLFDNQLTSVPPEIGRLTNLYRLYLGYNRLSSLPPEIGRLASLTRLDLTENRLRELPQRVRKLRADCGLWLHGNEELGLPDTVLGNSFHEWLTHEKSESKDAPQAGPILDYYFRTRQAGQRRPLCEGKLILVGRGDVGKTSLVRRLVKNEFSRGEDTTQGIRICPWEVYVGRMSENIRLHVWDFSGQEINHATHQFFLTDRSLYLLVLDGRADQQELEADYWLRLMSGFAPESPVIVVLNKIQKNRFDLNRGALRQKYPQIREFVETDCDNPGSDGQPGKHGYGIELLEQVICREVDQLPDVRQVFPKSWFAIKEQLAKSEKNFLTIDEYRAMCRKYGEAVEESQNNLSLFLHRLGIALNYSDDPRLRDRHVLNPHWLTDGIYRLLNSKRLAERKGELRVADLTTELSVRQYPPEMHRFLLGLMEKFELCFGFPGDDEKYLIPELLDLQQPAGAETFEPAACLNFRYLYPVLPPGLLPRFITRTHVLSEVNEQHRWRTGVILTFEGNTALVKGDAAEKNVQVLINGPPEGRVRMLAMIRQEFDAMHRDIPHLVPDELVAFPQAPQITVPFAELQVLYAASPETPVVRVAQGKVIQQAARELLEGVEFRFPEGIVRSDRRDEIGAVARSARGVGRVPTRQAAQLRRRRHVARSARGVGRVPDRPADASIRVFYSYAHADAKQRQKLAKHLSPLERIGLIHTWYDHEILPGAQLNEEVSRNLKEAEIVLYLVSPDFVSSNYCMTVELPEVVRRYQADRNTVNILLVIVRETNGWANLKIEDVRLGDLLALPESGNAIPNWRPNQDAGWANVARGVELVADQIRKGRRGG
jgi:internalin A